MKQSFLKSIRGGLPLAAAALVVALVPGRSLAAQDTQPVTTAPAKDLPQAASIIEKSIEAMGGRKALAEIKSRHTKVTMTTPMGEMQLETYVADKDRLLVKQSMPGMGEGAMGSDGKVAWANNPMAGGYQLLELAAVQAGSGQMDVLALVLDMEKNIGSMETVDRAEFNGRDCYKLHLVDKSGMEEHRYFDVETGLVQGVSQERETQMGPMEMVMHVGEWKEVGKIKVFSELTMSQMGMDLVMTLTEIQFNDVPDSVFDLPEEVKALLAEQPATQPEAKPETPPAR
ncbi:MAG: LolA-like protein [Planctomycetota bacterium]|jgi:hypothetical protein